VIVLSKPAISAAKPVAIVGLPASLARRALVRTARSSSPARSYSPATVTRVLPGSSDDCPWDWRLR
jgi:hypothetical protein